MTSRDFTSGLIDGVGLKVNTRGSKQTSTDENANDEAYLKDCLGTDRGSEKRATLMDKSTSALCSPIFVRLDHLILGLV